MKHIHYRQPNLHGVYGQAWETIYEAQPGDPPDWQASISHWIVTCPSYHPVWDTWVISTISLRNIPGVQPATKHYPFAEYEFMIAALDPAQSIDLERPIGTLRYLTPIDVVVQFHGLTEVQTKQLTYLAVNAIVNQGISPDQDHRRLWSTLISNTVAHLAAGCPNTDS